MTETSPDEGWRSRWAMINFRYHQATKQCLECKPRRGLFLDTDVMACRAAIEATAQDIWAFKDWLANHPTCHVDKETVEGFLNEPDGYHVKSCGDLATRIKHFRVDDRHRQLLELRFVGRTPSGQPPILFEANRVHFRQETANEARQRQRERSERTPSGDEDRYEDAVEMIKRGVEGWARFLQREGLA